jgi:hypothetical protein
LIRGCPADCAALSKARRQFNVCRVPANFCLPACRLHTTATVPPDARVWPLTDAANILRIKKQAGDDVGKKRPVPAPPTHARHKPQNSYQLLTPQHMIHTDRF